MAYAISSVLFSDDDDDDVYVMISVRPRLGWLTITVEIICIYRITSFPQETTNTDISHGSAATHLRCVEIFSDSIITNVLLIQSVK